MQFMYLRKIGTKRNPGNHPVGVLAVQKFEDCVQVAIATIHSEDRFEKAVGKEIVREKIRAGNVIMIGTESPVNLYAILPRGMGKRLNDYERHQEIFELLVKDEMEQSTWAKQNRDLLDFEDQRIKQIAKAIKIREEIRSEHGCAP